MSAESPHREPGGFWRRYAGAARYLWIVGVLLFAVAAYAIGFGRIRDTLLSVDPRWLGAMLLVDIAALWGRVLKWRLALGPGHNAAVLFFLAKAAGNASPGRVGELSPLLLRKHRSPRMAAWIVADRLLEMSATLGFGAAGLLLLRMPDPRLLAAVCAAMCLLVILPLLVLTRRRWFQRIAERTADGGRIHRLATFIAEIGPELARLRRKTPLFGVMTVLTTYLDLAAGILLLFAFGQVITFALAATVQCAYALTSAVPITPGATGVPYIPAAVLLRKFGRVPYEVFVAGIGLRVVTSNLLFWGSFLASLGFAAGARRDTRT